MKPTEFPLIVILDDGTEIDCTAICHIENNGIGAYEYWGMRGHDRGADYVIIDEVKPNQPLNAEQKEEFGIIIESERTLEKWEEQLTGVLHDKRKDVD
ncbi:MAG: hypothetical protein KGL39_08535 [Patescibacteria group bacterium]|nr:hypothetical protein [Patescibacteria group bacterium]